jgi:hypothetical protein
MSINNLRMILDSKKLSRVFEHWHEVRGNRLMPAWEDFRARSIKAELPIMWSYRYDSERDDFIGGLAGDAIQRLLGGTIKNVSIARVHDADYPRFFARAKRVLFQPAVFFGRGLLFKERARQCYGERIMLPFSNGDGHVKGILGATDFKLSFLYGRGVGNEAEHWVSLSVSPVCNSDTGT